MLCFFGSECEYINKANSIKQVQISQLPHTHAHAHTHKSYRCCVVYMFAPFDSDVFLSETLAFDQKLNDMQIKWCVLCVCVCVSVSACASMSQCAFESKVQLNKL